MRATTETRRRDPWLRSRVQLVSPQDGEWIEGELKLSRRLAFAERHSNDWLARQSYLMKHVDKWMRWRAAKGYIPIPGTLGISQPYELLEGKPVAMPRPAQFNADGVKEDLVGVRCMYRARREKPMYMTYDDFDAQQMWAKRAGIDLNSTKAKPTENTIPEGKDVIEVEGGENPMKVAEARRRKFGLKRKDLLIGELSEPLGGIHDE